MYPNQFDEMELPNKLITPSLHREHQLRNTTAAMKLKLLIHRNIVRPICFTRSSRVIRNYIFAKAASARSILDVSCGDDESIALLAKTYAARGFACDIARTSLKYLAQRHPSVSFCCANAEHIPFRHTFDVVIIKNTLHHLKKGETTTALLRTLFRLGKRVVVIDPHNPLNDSIRSTLWHFYYKKFLHDEDANFYNEEEFRDAICCALAGMEARHVVFDTLQTVKGQYLAATISANV